MFIINSIISNFELCLKRPDHQLDLTFMMTFYHVKHQAIKMHMPFFASIQIVTMFFFARTHLVALFSKIRIETLPTAIWSKITRRTFFMKLNKSKIKRI